MSERRLNLDLMILFILAVYLAWSEPGFAETDIPKNMKSVKVEVKADSANVGYEAWRAMDHDPKTMWHNQFSAPARTDLQNPIPISCGYNYGCNREHSKAKSSNGHETGAPFPCELQIDLKDKYTLNGFIYTPRIDNSNGRIAEFAFYLSDVPDKPGEPVISGVLQNNDLSQTVRFSRPGTGRYVTFKVLKEVEGRPFASIVELELLSDGVRFTSVPEVLDADLIPMEKNRPLWLDTLPGITNREGEQQGTPQLSIYGKCLVDEYNDIVRELTRKPYYQAIRNETANEQALILDSDETPNDVQLRRLTALLEELRQSEVETLKDNTSLQKADLTLTNLRKRSKTVKTLEDRFRLFYDGAVLRRLLMFSRPEIDFDRLLFVKKNRSNFNHICDQFYGRSAVPGGGLFVLNHPFDISYSPKAENILQNKKVENKSRLQGQVLEGGSFLSPDLSFEGDRISFAYVECTGSTKHIDHIDLTRGHTDIGRCYHLFSCRADGSRLHMLTDGTWNDFDPCFLPNGRMAFTSERRGGYLRCGRDCPNYTLFDMNEDGSKIRCLSYHETNEWNPSVTNDGRIIWTRWDYIDRFGCIAHHPWITSLDGRDPRSVHGNFSPRHLRADSELDVRAIPDSPKYIATAGPHHGQCYGSIILIDPQVLDDDAMGPVKRLTPDAGFPESQNGGQVWGMPWPLSESLFLAVADFGMLPGRGVQGGKMLRGDYGIYLADSIGNRELIYRDPDIGCASPIPFIARKKPPFVPALQTNDQIVHQPYVKPPTDFNAPRPEATISISNVYESLKPLPPKMKIKALRVVQVYCMSVPSGYPPHETGYREKSSLDSVNLARGSLGVVPVEEDGSAHFTVPANIEIYFQALDENGLAVQSMRSGTSLKEGEHLTCIGCHEQKHQAFTLPASSRALTRAPSRLLKEPNGSNPMNFPELVQPVLEKNCIECHDKSESQKKGAPNLHRDPVKNKFYASYNNLVGGGYAFYDYGDPLRTTPGKFGALASKLYRQLKDGHHDVHLTDTEMKCITIWLDLLSNFYGVYEKENGEKQLRAEKVYPTLE